MRKPRNNPNGYTLLEVLIAMSLFLMVIVPMMGYMSASAKVNKGRDTMIASCILEQEAAQISLFPTEIFSTKRRTVNGREWVIQASFEGNELIKCTLSAAKHGKTVDKVIFYVYK